MYFADNPASPLILVLFFSILKFLECDSKENTKSKWAKGVSYFGLGVVGLLEILSDKANDIEASFYVVTMCFIESIDMCFDSKIVTSFRKWLKGSYQKVKIEFVGPCLELKTISAPENKKQ